ncbi:TonB family protein [Paraburkholderia sp. RL18-103-BIB-C]|jgi:protein TonB|uniref:TonB family protein n=1 Tax=unclassified Paraburkholderia TaxID=2615204 RepID=UPI0038B92360
MSSMPTVAQHAPHPGTRKPLYMSATLALAVEALLLAGVGAWLIHPRISAPRRPEPMTITLAPPAAQAPKPAPVPAREVSKPVPKPAVQLRRAPAVHQARVAHAAPPKPQPVTPPPTSIPAPNTAPAQSAAAAEPAPAPAPAPRPASAPVPAPALPDASFEAALRAAIEAALRYPESARMEGITGRTLVGFVYRDGVVSDIHVVTSGGMGLLDHAALAAVRDAVCPPPPHGLEGKNLPEQLWVDFTLDSKG